MAGTWNYCQLYFFNYYAVKSISTLLYDGPYEITMPSEHKLKITVKSTSKFNMEFNIYSFTS